MTRSSLSTAPRHAKWVKNDMQSTSNANELTPQEYFVRADELLGQAADLIARARCEDATGTAETCSLIQDLIDGVRVPLRRLGGIE